VRRKKNMLKRELQRRGEKQEKRTFCFVIRLSTKVQSMSRRYFVHRPIVGPTAVLEGGEAHHLLHVMRAKKGAAITLFDGGGAEFAAVVLEISRSRATC